MFQKETISWRKTLILGIGVVSMLLSFQVQGSDITKEAYLAEVSIDDLLFGKTSSDARARNKAKEQQSIQESTTSNKRNDSKVERFKLSETMMLEEVKYQLAKHFKLNDNFRISFDRAWKEVSLKTPDWKIVMTSFPPQGLRSQFYVNFELWAEGQRISNFQESVRCELWVDAYVALQRLDRGMVMSQGLVSIQPVDSLSLYQRPVELGASLSDYILVNGVKPGEPICWRDLRERPLVQKNNIIDVVAQDGLMKVSLKAKALEDGVKGQLIRVRNLQSYSDIQAEVIGVNKARVYF